MKKKNIKKAVAVTGVAAGIGAAIAGAFFFRKKENRDKAKKVYLGVKSKVKKEIKKVKAKAGKK